MLAAFVSDVMKRNRAHVLLSDSCRLSHSDSYLLDESLFHGPEFLRQILSGRSDSSNCLLGITLLAMNCLDDSHYDQGARE